MSSTNPLILILLLTGFTTGFGHCIGMCGPIVVSLSLELREKGVWIPMLLYNGGRITTYALLGGLMGMTGSFTLVASRIAQLQKGMMIFAGILIVIMGLAMSGWVPFGRVFGDHVSGGEVKSASNITRSFRKLTARRSIPAYYVLGLLLGLLPCGPVYTALVAAARTGMEGSGMLEGFIKGMSLMAAFGLGTVPALILVARLSDMKWLKSRDVIYKIGAMLMVIVGIYFIIEGIRF